MYVLTTLLCPHELHYPNPKCIPTQTDKHRSTFLEANNDSLLRYSKPLPEFPHPDENATYPPPLPVVRQAVGPNICICRFWSCKSRPLAIAIWYSGVLVLLAAVCVCVCVCVCVSHLSTLPMRSLVIGSSSTGPEQLICVWEMVVRYISFFF
ncbi:hypothetical protein F4818DRAFT_100809 [Hypoxylon cercidicola]|nr:hypothetical protein F4818DRAFT_100809 [Hypoxylon cercidicola]